MPHLLATELDASGTWHVHVPIERLDILPRSEQLSPLPSDRLHDHRGNEDEITVAAAVLAKGLNVDFLQPWQVSEGDVSADEGEVGPTAGAPQRAVLVIWGAVIPGAEALADGVWELTGWVMRVEESEEVGSKGAGVGFFQARKGEGARDEEAGFGIRRPRRLMGMQRTAIMFW